MRYIKIFENFNQSNVLIVVDVQRSFRKFFTENYVNELKKYCKNFTNVYQIFDNHVDGKNPDVDYLYDNDPNIESIRDLYQFPNQKDIIEKRYQYNVGVDFFKKILDTVVYNDAKYKEDKGLLRRGDFFLTTEGTIIVYIGNNHVWHHLPKKLYNLFIQLKGKEVIICGGSQGECILDIEVAAKSLGVKIIENKNFIYSASFCPIK